MATERCIICELGLEHPPRNNQEAQVKMEASFKNSIQYLLNQYLSRLSILDTKSEKFNENVRNETISLIEKSITTGLFLQSCGTAYLSYLGLFHSKN